MRNEPTMRLGRRAGRLDRLLRPFADVRGGEAGMALLLFANLLVLLLACSILETAREPLILGTQGAEVKSYASGAQALALIVLVPLYSWLSSRLDRRRLLVAVCGFFLVSLELLYLGVRAPLPGIGAVLFVWVGVFDVAAIAQLWSLANDLYDRDAGRRLFPLIALGATAGRPLGAFAAGRLIADGVPAQGLVQAAAALLLVQLALYVVADRRAAQDTSVSGTAPGSALSPSSGFALVLRSPYLRLIALLLVVLSAVGATGEYVLGSSVRAAADARAAARPGFDTEAFIGSFYAGFHLWANLSAFLLQAFLVSRLVRHAGVAGAVLALPLLALGAHGFAAAGAGFATLRLLKIAEAAAERSAMATGRQLLWLPTSREEKYAGKQAVDTFFVRAGDLVSAGLVFAGTHWLGLGTRGFALASVALGAVGLAVALATLRRHDALAAADGEAV